MYGQPFGVDVAYGDPTFGELEVVLADDVLSFAGIAPPAVRVYPIETHIAEKLHAYTMPRQRPNTRVKDLPDMALLATAQPIDGKRLRKAFEQTFVFRKTHALPSSLPAAGREDDVCGFQRDVRATHFHCDANACRRKGGAIIHAIPDHRDLPVAAD